LEDSGIDFDLLYAGTIESAKCCEDAGLLASAGGSEEEKVWEVG
jgi:hypothetical protein